MARGSKTLNYQQQQRLRAVAEADAAWKEAKAFAKAEVEAAKKRIDQQIAQHALMRDRAIYEAVKAGVPKTLIGRDGLGNTNPYAVYDALQRMEFAEQAGEIDLTEDRFAWSEILAVDDNWVYGWIVDTGNPMVNSTFKGGGTPVTHNGYFVYVDKRNAVVTVTEGERYYTGSDPGFEELREWAVAHAAEVEPK